MNGGAYDLARPCTRKSVAARTIVDHAPGHRFVAVQTGDDGDVRFQGVHVQGDTDVPRQERIEAFRIAGDEAIGFDEGGRRQIFQAASLPGAAPRLERLFADRIRQQPIAHGLRGAVAFVNQRRRPSPIERAILFERHIDDDIGGGNGAPRRGAHHRVEVLPATPNIV